MTTYYGKLNQTGAEANVPAWELATRPDLILMQGPPPSGVAIANADGTWSEPETDYTLSQAEEIINVGWEILKQKGIE